MSQQDSLILTRVSEPGYIFIRTRTLHFGGMNHDPIGNKRPKARGPMQTAESLSALWEKAVGQAEIISAGWLVGSLPLHSGGMVGYAPE